MHRVASYFGQWSNGTLPAEGGILDQSASFIHAMRILEIARGEMDTRRQQEMEARARKAQQGSTRPRGKERRSKRAK